MTDEQFKQLISAIRQAKSDYDSLDLSGIATTLKNLEDLAEKQVELLGKIMDKLDEVYEEIPTPDLSSIESDTSSIKHKLDSIDSNLNEIERNTRS